MPGSIFEIYARLPAFLLVLFRVSGLMLAAPLFSSAVIPVRIRLLLIVGISAAVFPLAAGHLVVPVTLGTAVAGLLGELAIGLFIGFCLSVMLLGVQMAAEIVSHQAGILLGTVFNPMMDSSESVISQLYYFAAIMFFLAVGGHRHVVRALLDSFATLPPLAFRLTDGLTELMLGLIRASFEIAIQVSGPAVVALMLTLLALGFVSRTMPQLNILTIGFPIKLMVALLIMGLTMISLEPLLLEAFSTSLEGIYRVLCLQPPV